MIKIVLSLLVFIYSNSINAEVYKDFVPLTTIEEMKKNYPNAKFEILKSAWVKENQQFLKITGSGLPGEIYVFTSKKSSEEVQEQNETYQKRINENPEGDNALFRGLLRANERYMGLEDDAKYTIRWLRWSPNAPFPIERLISKYGKPEKYDFTEEDYTPYAQWIRKGMLVILSDDKKLVYSIEYSFTDEDYKKTFGNYGSESDEPSTSEQKVIPAKPKGKSVKTKKE